VTSTTDAAGHPEVEELSDLTEGILPPTRTANVRQHLDDCALCADVYSSLEEIRGLLGTLPGPTHMPADVASRIDAALAAEALLNATVPGPGVAASRSVSGSDEDEGTHVSRETWTSEPADRPTGHPRATVGPGRTRRSHRARRRTFVLGGVFTAAALGLGTLLVQSLGGDNSGETPGAAAQTDAAHTFSAGKLENHVSVLLSQQKSKSNGGRGGSGKPELGAGSVGPNVFDGPAVSVPKCIEKGIGSDEAALASEQGVYKGTNVYLVVLANTSDNTKVTAYIVDAACTKQASASSGEVLLTHSYPRS
jgi:anti-sigma factor RsiW